MTARFAAVLVGLGSLTGCYPGYCSGAVRGVDDLRLNLDTGLKSGSEVLASSQLTPSSVLLQGPDGPVPLQLEAFVNKSAHSCASAGGLRATPTAPLGPGDYTFIVLMDQVKWPAVDGDAVTTWQGHPAIVRHFHVR